MPAGRLVTVPGPVTPTVSMDRPVKIAVTALVPRVTVIKAVHVTDLRLAIDQERTRRGLGAFSWTDPVLTPGITVVA